MENVGFSTFMINCTKLPHFPALHKLSVPVLFSRPAATPELTPEIIIAVDCDEYRKANINLKYFYELMHK